VTCRATRDILRRSSSRNAGTIDDRAYSDYLNEIAWNMLMSMVSNRRQGCGERLPTAGAFILGFAFSAFFDGILLHQVLQWHHLLSLVQGESFRNMRVQILADGIFHLASYILATAGLLLLWRSRRTAPPDRVILAWAIFGFAAWQFADVILVHWAIGLHRVRVDVPNPLPWDIGWLVAFGLAPLVAGILLWNAPRIDTDRTGRSRAMLSVAVTTAGALSALPLGGAATAVIFKDSMNAAEAFVAVAAAGGRVIWSAPCGEIIIIDLPPRSDAHLYAKGALLVTSASWFGCFVPASPRDRRRSSRQG
jgi:uncharacterized membrane protein